MDDYDDLESTSIHDLDHAPELPAHHHNRSRSYSAENAHPLQATERSRRWSSGSAATLHPASSSFASVKQWRFNRGETTHKKRTTDHARSSSSSQLPSTSNLFQLPTMDFIEETEEDSPTPLRVRSKSDSETRASRFSASPEKSFMSEPTSSHHASLEDSATASEQGDETLDTLEISSEPIIIMGLFKLPSWLHPNQRFTWSALARFIVTPLWCVRYPQITERAVLQRLNILCGLFAAVQLASALWLVLTLFRFGKYPETVETQKGQTTGEDGSRYELLTNVWTLNGNIILIGFLALVLFISAVMNMPVIRNVNLVGAIRYLWILLWVVPFMLFCVIGCFDYFRVTQVWIKHWWRDDTLGRFREWFCNPSETAHTLCAAPIVPNVTEWCLENYNSPACGPIRDAAQEKTERFLLGYYYMNAAWGLCMVLLLLMMVNTLENIISRPLVQKSRESNVPAWFSLPIIGCLGVGSLYAFHQTSVLSTSSGSEEASWIGPLYIAAGGLFFLAAVLGWFISSYSILNTRDKRCKLVTIILFIFVAGTIFAILVTIFAGSIGLSISLVESVSEAERGRIACSIDQAETCTRCDRLVRRCPEWTDEDVTKILQTQAKSSATLAAIFLLYALSALRFGFTMRKFILLYQIDYV